jgi:hypothetical protein
MAVNNNCSFKAGIISIADAIFRFVNREGHHCSIEIIDIECVLLFFSVKILSPQNGGFIRAFWLVPDSCGKEFARLQGVSVAKSGILSRDLGIFRGSWDFF